MPKPSERIAEMVRAIVDQRMAEAKADPNYATLQTMQKLLGTSDADIAESMLKDPKYYIAAIITYLDEREGL